MKFYQSTRGGARATAPEAILQGIAPDGGLFTPEAFPRLDMEKMLPLDAMGISTAVLSALLDGFSEAEMARIVREGYAGKFESDELTPLVKVGGAHILELFRGPTSAFKDVALSLLPRLMTASRDKVGAKEEIAVLTATSGDTGKAALERRVLACAAQPFLRSSANTAFTPVCASSKLPRTAHTRTFWPRWVRICAFCTSLTPSSG